MQTFDLGNGWFINFMEDATATVRNPDKGQRIYLPADSLAKLRELFKKEEAPTT